MRPWDANAVGWLVATRGGARARGPGPCILCPILHRLDAGLAEIAAALPIGDANGLLMDALSVEGRVEPHVVAGVMANDPFRHFDEFLGSLFERGVRTIVNWPSVGPLSGELAAAFTHSGFTFENELEMLSKARARGFAVTAFVVNADHGRQALALEPEMLILAPPPGTPGSEGRAALARDLAKLGAALRAQAAGTEVRIYLGPDVEMHAKEVSRAVAGVIRFDAG